jgi:hypothetical protein
MRSVPYLAATVAAAVMLPAAPAIAGPQQGVKCPSGFTATITDENRKLVCSRNKTYELASICSPVAFSNAGITVGGNIVMEPNDPTGDKCLAVVTGQKVPSVMSPPLPGYPPVSAFKRVNNTSGPDKFVATVAEYAFPEGKTTLPPYLGDASKGVRCPSGWDGDKVYDGKGIRCDKYDGAPKPADCDGIALGPLGLGWRWQQDHVGAEDRCIPMGAGNHVSTKPQGMTGVQFDAERASDSVGWVLNKRSGARDTWQRKVYAFPEQVQ